MQGQSNAKDLYRDLWSLAAAKLKDKDRSHVLHLTVSLESLHAAVEERQRECVEKQWSVNRIGSDKSKIILRDVFAKIAFWIDKFVQAGDVAVQYDPGHAALPWALVRFLLKVSVQDVQQYAVLAEGLETVARVVAQYKIVEKLYLGRTGEGTSELESSIVNLYTLVLKFLIRTQHFYSKNTVERVFINVFDVREKFRGYLDDIAKQQDQVQKYIALVDTQQRKDLEDGLTTLSLEEKDNYHRLKKSLEDIQRPISRMERRLEDVHDNLESAQRQAILCWLSPIPYMQHHLQSKKDILDGTGSWFLNDDRLIQWRSSSSSSIMWLRGIAGSGKSKLLSTFIEQQITEFRDGKNPMPRYFYCARNATEPERADPAAIFRTLVQQMSRLHNDGSILDPVQRVYKARERDNFAAGPLTIAESKALIIELSQFHPLTTIVIDALDECDPILRGELFDALTEILQRSNGLVKILVSSRNERDIICELAGCHNLEIEAKHNQADIKRFVNHEVDGLIRKKRLLYGNVPDDLRQMIKDVLCEKASGMFRWVGLQLQFLRTLKIAAAVRKRLGELPADLREAYDDTYKSRLESSVEEQRSIAQSAFKLLLALQTPIDHGAFTHALSFCSEDRITLCAEDLLDLCFGFLVLDTELNVYRFAHLSVREYLETKSEYSPESSHALAAQFCLRYLCTSNNSGPFLIPRDTPPDNAAEGMDVSNTDIEHDSRVMSWTINPSDPEDPWPSFNSEYPFLDRVQEYACCYWADHTAGSQYLRLVHPLKSMLQDFIMDAPDVISPWFMYWHRLVTPMERLSGYYICMPGWTNSKIAEVARAPRDYLFTASLWGFLDLLETRLRSKPDPLRLHSEQGYNALQLACKYGNRETVRFLLDWGWSIQSEDKYTLLGITIEGSQCLDEPLSFTTSDLDDSYMETVEFLLSRGADPNEKHYGYSLSFFPIIKAIEAESGKLVKLLLDHGANPNVEDEDGWNPFDKAVSWGNNEIVDLVLTALQDVDEFSRIVCKDVILIRQALRDEDENLMKKALGSWTQDARASKYLDFALLSAVEAETMLAKQADAKARSDLLFDRDLIDHQSQQRDFFYSVILDPRDQDLAGCWGQRGEYVRIGPHLFPLVQLLLDHGADPCGKKYVLEHPTKPT